MKTKNIEIEVKEVIADLLKVASDSLDLDKSFLELGINSVMAVELIEAINQKLEIELGVEAVFDYRGIRDLAKYIVNQYGNEFQSREFQQRTTGNDDRSFVKTETVRYKNDNKHQYPFTAEERDSDIAIIGISGKFAGSETITEFWDHLQAGDCCIKEIDREGWEVKDYYHLDPAQKNKSISKWGGLLKNIFQFDASFFNILPPEAARMDPQQRLFLEEAFKAFEDGGYPAEQLSGKKIGVFVGGRTSEYKETTLLEQDINAQTFLGNEMSILAARISYFFNLKGPSLVVDTACSSSLAAVHLACESIHRGESEMALAGGVFVVSSPEFFIMSSKMGMLSPDGKCRTFDKNANGMVLGEGVGVLILKLLKTSIEDGDYVYGIIKGSTISHSGKTNGITSPNILSQKELISEAYKNAAIHPETIGYVEAHGTGTKLGDLIEIKALTEAFRMFTDKTQFCAIGSHKPNFGHSPIVAGIAGIFKVLMGMKYHKIPPTISIEEINPNIDFTASPFFVNHTLQNWEKSAGNPLRAGVSSFGSGGTNCHLIIEEPPYQKNAGSQERPYYLFPFSAKTKVAFHQKMVDMAQWLEKEANNYSLEDISYTLFIGRSHFPLRGIFMAGDLIELKQEISEVIKNGTAERYSNNESFSASQITPELVETDEKQTIELPDIYNLTAKSYQEQLLVVLDLYIKGHNLNWGSLFKKGKCYRIPLPTYPFNGDKYCIPETKTRKAFSPKPPDLTEISQSPATEAVNPDELITIYPECFPSIIQIIRKHISKPEIRPVNLNSNGGLRVKEMDELLCKLLLGQLYSIGLFVKKNPVRANRKTKTGLPGFYKRWLEESQAFLVRNNFLRREGESWVVTETAPVDVGALWREWDQRKGSWLDDLNLKAQVKLVEATLRALPDIISGKIPATDIMFPNSSMELVEGIYRNNSVAVFFNEVIANIVVAYIEERLKQKLSAQIRILEVGAGIGGTSTVIFTKLKPYQKYIQEYCYTDVSKAFLMFAEKEYGSENPYLTYQIYDVEKPVAGQNIDAGGYDMVIAANVLHATGDIRRTLRNAKVALRKNGLILLNELSGNSVFLHLTFGLLEGWWLNEDTALRIPGCPGLLPETWQAVLECEGFRSILFPAAEQHDLGQQIVVAESDGIVRQKQVFRLDTPSIKSDVITKQSGGVNRKQLNPELIPPVIPLNKAPESFQTNPTQITGDLTDRMIEDHVREVIIEKLSESLNVDTATIDVDASFRDYGLDSILGVNLIQVINLIFNIELETTILFDYRSVNHLTGYILTQYRDKISEVLRSNLNPMGIHKDVSNFNHRERQVDSANSESRSPGRVLPVSGAVKEERLMEAITKEPIAIIGMSGRFAKSGTVDELWEHLSKGDDLIEKLSRWDLSKYYSPNISYCNYGSFLDGIDQFDPLFFNISGLEATYMDPQQRLFLEEAWKALEDAGYAGSGIQGRQCGVYVGCGAGDYQQLLGDDIPAQAFWGNMGSIVPARIAYYLDLKGPAIVVDTACSSSLVAIHLACQGLWGRETEMALAGGVYIHTTPGFYLSAGRAGMLSSIGRCHAFDDRADGFVPGEGVGVLLLKRLQEAMADGDHIYGVIRGSGINQDGATNGITAPSAISQEKLECYVYDTFQIDPEQIQMVEAHGTGTKLGDPIEYQALTRAFKKYTDKQEYCAIGSIKTNIGHTQIAAGVAGVIKILLSLKHKQIPPSLHFESGNSNIQFKESPFYVNTRLRDWEVKPDDKRCAIISSFGASGTNAHMAIEEAPTIEPECPEKPVQARGCAGYLIVLSARTSEQLRQQVEQLTRYCEMEPQVDCGNMSYTLLLGRKHFNHRLACIIRNQSELVALFTKWLEKGKASSVYISIFNENEQREQPSLKRYGNQCIQDCQNTDSSGRYLEHLAAIAELYVQGYVLEFKQLFVNGPYSRISLPTYPFARESYWIPELNRASKRETKSTGGDNWVTSTNVTVIHPLLHQNISDFSKQQFSSILTGREFFLTDHLVNGKRVLPGVAHLEMVRAAVVQSIEGWNEERTMIRFENIVWMRPIVVDQPLQIHIGLFPKGNGEISYQIDCQSKETGAGPVIYSRGKVVLCPVAAVPSLDLDTLQTRINQRSMTSGQCYQQFRSMGLDYGPGHQGIEKVYVGSREVLTKLSLPASVSDTQNQFSLHPSLMDSALQASLVLIMDAGESKPFLPFALQELEIFGGCTSPMWALIQYSGHSMPGDTVPKFDIDLCDETGAICVRIKALSLRAMLEDGAGSGDLSSYLKAGALGTLMLYPYWKEQAIHWEPTYPATVTFDYALQRVFLCELENISPERIETQMNGIGRVCHCQNLQSEQKDIDKRFIFYATRVFEEIQKIHKSKPRDPVLIQIVVSLQDEGQLFAGLSGLLKTAHLENPKLFGQLIQVEQEEDTNGITAKLKENSQSPHDIQIRYRNHKRWVAGFSEIEASLEQFPLEAAGIPWKDHGIYLITGGLGGLGLIFAKEIVARVKNPILILIGRTPLTGDKQSKLKKLAISEARIEYQQVDVTDKKAVEDLIQSIRGNYGGLNGIIHCAGVIRDNYIHKKTKEELQEVLAPKVTGLINLDQASKDLNLDFLILFSSISGVMGNSGQADYASANAFMDSYAGYRDTLVSLKQRHGLTLSIDWPLWSEGGMRIDRETEKMMLQNSGLINMQTSTGIKAFYHGLTSGRFQIIVMEGNLALMKHQLLSTPSPITAWTKINPGNSREVESDDLLNKVRAVLRQTASELLKIGIQNIDGDTELGKYGFDSILFTEFANQLNQEYMLKLTPAIFFERPTLNRFAEYLLEEYQEVLAAKVITQTGTFGQEAENKTDEYLSGIRYSRFDKTAPLPPVNSNKHTTEAVAIVGISGIFPMARDMNEFWKNLIENKDCISEIPEERWDWRAYYGDPATEANKTNIKWGGFIDGVAEFEPQFFGISPKETELMDPQQRLLMTYVWKAIEDAGIAAGSLSGTKTGIFVGTMNSGYSELLSRANIAIEGYSSTGMVPSVGPNRMSYILDIHGPSEPIETACSSSLVAIHRAVCAIENGTCEMAIAGGINTILTPDLHISFSKAGMLSKDGRCKTFSSQANGYVRGEGVGMLFLKKLKSAEQSGDHIYGVIRGTAENHGGRANSLTAPNQKAQADLLVTAYTKAGIDPRTITYIEAHGTGTELGDPVEINGLKAAFKELYQATGEPQITGAHCGIGSVKTNIGHLELAAGVAGIIKVLLQLKHRTLVKSLHCDNINPYIQLKDSPFYIVQETKEWKALLNAEGKELPRRAGVSSFGFGGVNAHVVLEEYISQSQEQSQLSVDSQNPAIIVLSAKNEVRLKVQVEQLLSALEQQQFSDSSLANIAYTLQVGREAMEERLALIVNSMDELKESLKSLIADQDKIPYLYRGQTKRNKETIAVFTADEDLENAIDTWIAKRKYMKLLDLWVKGLTFDWNKLYGDIKPRRISLPTYPFARERYWVPGPTAGIGPAASSGTVSSIHPLLQQNTSGFSGQRFSPTFTGREFFLTDHVINGERVLPGVVYLEMARAAVESAMDNQMAGTLNDGRTGIQLKNIVWVQPIIVTDNPVQVHIRLLPKADGQIPYEIYGESGKSGSGPVVYSRGIAMLRSNLDVPAFDIQALKTLHTQSVLSSSQCYEFFDAAGIHYGPGHRGIDAVYVGQGQVMAKLSLPASVFDTKDRFILHPSLIDSALQASIGLMVNFDTRLSPGSQTYVNPIVPFALRKMEIFNKCTSAMWALLRYSNQGVVVDKVGMNGPVDEFDIDLLDDQGALCVRMEGLSARLLTEERQVSNKDAIQSRDPILSLSEANMLAPVWEVFPVNMGQTLPLPTDEVIIIGGTKKNRGSLQKFLPNARILEIQSKDTVEIIARKLDSNGSINYVFWIAPHRSSESIADDALIDEQNQGVLQVFRLIKALLHLGYGTKNLSWCVITFQTQFISKNDSINPTHASLPGLIGTLAKEYPNWKIRLIDLEAETPAGMNWPVADIFSLVSDSRGNAWVYRGREWYRQALIPVCYHQSHPKLYKSEGVYVVIGGAGGIGEVWSEYMIRTYQARIVWIGRRPMNTTIQAKLNKLTALGVAPLYITADATNRKDLQQAYEEIKKQYSKIDGVVHSAIVLADQSLLNMEEEQFKAGLTAKVDVSVRLAQVFQKEPLDFVMFFSSLQSFIKAPGQSNYASGCTFMDAFAHQLSREWPCAVKVMNWGYWGNIGIVASQAYRERMAQIGMGSIEPPEAMKALEILTAGPIDQVVFIKTIEPMTIEGVNAAESMTNYPAVFPSNIRNVRNHISKQDPPLRNLKPEMLDLAMKKMKMMDDLLHRLLWGQLQSTGMFEEKYQSMADLKTKIGLSDLYERWFEESLAVLTQENYLIYQGGVYSVNDAARVDCNAVWKEWEQQKGSWLEDPDMRARALLIEATLRVLPDVLTGKVSATDIIFPNSSFELVAEVYHHNLIADYFNELLADTLVIYIKERIKQDPEARIRLIEIGAGTGGTSTMVFQKLKPYLDYIQEYCYTDISKAFLMYAEKEYGPQNPYLTYKIFNVEKPVAGQEISAGGYDIAIAANVLHATKDIRQTLRNVKAVLQNTGLIFFNELTGDSLFLHLTFGLLEGWWLYEDAALRIKGSPGLAPETWQTILESEGFRSVFFPAGDANELGQQIIVADSDGVVRQEQQIKPDVPLTKQSLSENRLPARQDNPPPFRSGEQYPVAPAVAVIDTDVTGQMVESHVKMTIREKLSESLKVKIDMIDDDESFADYGVDSITGVNLIQVINQVWDIELETTSLFDYSSVDQLTAYILSRYQDRISATLRQSIKQVTVYNDYTLEEEFPVYTNPPLSSGRKTLPEPDLFKEPRIEGSIQKNPIAIIGMSGRFAKSGTVSELWEHLAKGDDLVEEVTRWDLSQHNFGKTNYCNYGSFIEDIARFDPLFFNISGHEATYMDPQQRLFLEEAWKALEDAGYAGTGMEGRLCGVYVGCCPGDYQKLLGDHVPAQAFWGNAGSVIPARIAYYLNLKGPAITVDTACSSSLVALHLACQGLWTEETEMALAGGVFVHCTPDFYLTTDRAGMLSPTGRCYTFDDRADGFIPGEGVGVLVLKRLQEAIADGDHIYGVIRGSGINQDGTTNGITAPSAISQERLERQIYDTFQIDPEQLQLVEAHGTGTKLGDPIEYQALTRAFRKYTEKQEYCAIGSLKTNIGHTAAASGIAGIIKVLLSLKHKQIPPSLHFQSGNPNIQFNGSPFYVNTVLKNWEIEPGAKRCAAVSSFGFSGTNAHVVIEEAPKRDRQHSEKPGYLIVLAARTFEQLRRQVELLVEYCEREPQVDCGNMSYTLITGRKHFNCRLACVVRNQNELISLFGTWLEKNQSLQVYVAEIHENEHREQPSLKQFGNQCILNCQNTNQTSEYLENLSTIAELYVQGYTLKFEQLFSNDHYSRISLPTYPFAGEHYWIAGMDKGSSGSNFNDSAIAVATAFEAGERSPQRKSCFLKKQWEPCEAIPNRQLNRTIAILMSNETDELATQLSQLFPKSQLIDTSRFDPRLQQPEHGWSNYDGCIDLTGCGRTSDESLNWITWLQQLIEEGHKDGLMLLCVTKGLESYRNTVINFSGVSRAGLYRMLQSEYRHVQSRHMDADPLMDDMVLARLIAAEFLIDCEEPEICYRNEKRYRAFLEELPESGNDGGTLAFPGEHVLWITGGTRGLGYLCAEHFVKQYGVKRLVLTGRDIIPPETEWDFCEGQDSAVAKKIQAIRALKAQGVQVRVLSVSLTDESAVQKSLEDIKNTLGPIGGIIHCSGIADLENPAFIRKSVAGIQQVLNPKVAGLDIMYRSFNKEPLQFFILFSSVSAAIPALASGQSDYTMANAYMDYFAEFKTHTCPIISIQWPSWKETGIGEIKSRVFQQTGLLSLTNAEGLQLLDHIISRKMGPVVMPAVVNPDLWKPDRLLRSAIRETSLAGEPVRYSMTRDLSMAPNSLVNATRVWLTGLFAKELKIDPGKLIINASFQKYGMDSILLAQVIQRIERELKNIHLEPSSLLEYSSIESLADYLTQAYPEALRFLFQGSDVDSAIPENQPILAVAKQEKGIELYPGKVDHPRNKIAIVGMACHFPDAMNIGEFWINLKSGKDSIREVPKFRWDWEKYYHVGGYEEGKSISKWGAFLERIEEFDPGFFEIPESLAPQIDPLQRQWLEVSAEALADAGYEKKDLWGKRVGVFVGSRTGNFGRKINRNEKDFIVGIGQNFIAAHLAHIYNFKGPNMVVDTACSSSLTAIHLAVKSIQNGESDVALAGGVDILLDESTFLSLSAAKILSPDGRCKTFDAGADGIGLGEGCGVLVLKPLTKAIQDCDKIYGVIDGSAINNDGNTMGVTTPNPEAQRELIEKAIDNANINPETIGYIEAHGTGTLIGDPIELKALTRVFGEYTSKKQFCGVGSVKSNLGHSLSAAGAASIIKVLLAIIHHELPPTLHCGHPNPRFNFDESPFYLIRELKQWTGEQGILRAGISAFGLGGNNAHIVISNEGIPATHQANLEPKGPKVIFNRKFYWPDRISHDFQNEALDFAVQNHIDSTVAEEDEFLKIFKMVEV